MTEDANERGLELDPDAFDWDTFDDVLRHCSPGDYLAINGALETASRDETLSESDRFIHQTYYNDLLSTEQMPRH